MFLYRPMFDWYKKWQDVISSLFTRQEVGSSSVVYFDWFVSSDDAGESVRVPAVEGGEDDHLVGGAVRDRQLVAEPTKESCKYFPLLELPHSVPCECYLSQDLSALSSSLPSTTRSDWNPRRSRARWWWEWSIWDRTGGRRETQISKTPQLSKHWIVRWMLSLTVWQQDFCSL